MTRISTWLSMITLNVNGLNSTIKRHRLLNWIKTHNLTIFTYKKNTSLKKTNIGLKL
jgi:exonuclease III